MSIVGLWAVNSQLPQLEGISLLCQLSHVYLIKLYLYIAREAIIKIDSLFTT
jgi:hypothetical protein